MATQANQPAGSNAPPQHKEVENFTEAERTEWLKTGAMPALEQDSPANGDTSATSKPGAGNSGKKAESGTAEEERPHEKRIKELSAREKAATERAEAAEREREALRLENEEYKTGKRKPEEKKAETAGPKLLELPVRPKMKDFMANGALDHEKYETALDKYEADKTAYTNQQVQMRTAAAEQERSITTWRTDLTAKYGDKAKDLDVKSTVDKLANTMQDAPAFFMFLNDSKNFVDLLYVLGGKEFKLDELLAEAKDPKTMTSAIRKLRDIERDVESELAKAANKSDETPKKKDNLTGAGTPPKEAAGGTSSPSDDGSPDAAWKRKDLSREERGELYRERKNKLEREGRRKKVN